MAITVELRDERGFSLHASHNLSEGGAYFGFSIPFAVGSKVKVSFRLPGEEGPIVCEGVVANIPDQKDFGMGVRFVNMQPEDQRRLAAFTQEQQEEP